MLSWRTRFIQISVIVSLGSSAVGAGLWLTQSIFKPANRFQIQTADSQVRQPAENTPAQSVPVSELPSPTRYEPQPVNQAATPSPEATRLSSDDEILQSYFKQLPDDPDLILRVQDDGKLRQALLNEIVRYRDDKYMPPLREMLHSSDNNIRADVLSALNRIGTPAAHDLIYSYNAENPPSAEDGAKILRSIPNETFDQVVNAVERQE